MKIVLASARRNDGAAPNSKQGLALQKSLTNPAELVALVKRLTAEDRTAFAELYEATSAKMFGTALRILKRRDLAEEVLQDVYISVMQKAGTYDASKGSVIAWMATIVRNRSLDIVRRATPIQLDGMSGAEDVADEDPDALTALTQAEDTKRLLGCLEGLDPQKKELVLLAYFHGESREALSSRYNCPVGTIKTWLHRSLGQLRDCLTQ